MVTHLQVVHNLQVGYQILYSFYVYNRYFYHHLILYYYTVSTWLYINSAPSHYIQHIPDVGPTICQKILDERKKKRFTDADDLKSRVPEFPLKQLQQNSFYYDVDITECNEN